MRRLRACRRTAGFLFAFLALGAAGAAASPEPPEPPDAEIRDPETEATDAETADAETADAETTDAEAADTETATASSAEGEGTGEADESRALRPCRGNGEVPQAWLDRMQQGVYRSVCSSALWFDSFFGDPRALEESDATYGRLGAVVLWDEHDGLDLDVDFDAKFSFPRLENRLNAFLRRDDRDDVLADTSEDIGQLPELFRDTTDDEWLAGLGYTPLRNARRRFDLDVGVDLDFPVDPYVKARYRLNLFAGERRLMRFRQTAFWRDRDGFGTTTRVDLERLWRDRFLLRWLGVGTWAQKIDGVRWYWGATLYHGLDGDRAFAYRFEARGESDAPVAVEEYGVRAVYRESIARNWFFVELQAGLSWPREVPGAPRETSVGFGVGFDMLFGDHPSLARRPDSGV